MFVNDLATYSLFGYHPRCFSMPGAVLYLASVLRCSLVLSPLSFETLAVGETQCLLSVNMIVSDNQIIIHRKISLF